MTVYIRDARSHSTISPKVLGAARMKGGTLLVYVRRSVDYGGMFQGHLFDMYAQDYRYGEWRNFKKPPGLVEFICTRPVGTVGRASNITVEVVSFSVEVPNRCIDVPSPSGGWNWQKAMSLSERERRNVARNLGPMA